MHADALGPTTSASIFMTKVFPCYHLLPTIEVLNIEYIIYEKRP